MVVGKGSRGDGKAVGQIELRGLAPCDRVFRSGACLHFRWRGIIASWRESGIRGRRDWSHLEDLLLPVRTGDLLDGAGGHAPPGVGPGGRASRGERAGGAQRALASQRGAHAVRGAERRSHRSHRSTSAALIRLTRDAGVGSRRLVNAECVRMRTDA